jgi:hypothetical protein
MDEAHRQRIFSGMFLFTRSLVVILSKKPADRSCAINNHLTSIYIKLDVSSRGVAP